ncbi:MAG TPA: hypothetical protein VMD59_12840 [Acidimicrobiales bacterium]|nr:hypothetical protein [Acidimicrobiales bacterium]
MTTTRAGSGGLEAIARPDGTLSILAMDQRNTLRRMLEAASQPIDAETMRAFKVDVTAALSPAASGVLLDPDLGVPAVEAAGARAESCGLLVAAEPAERQSFEGEPRAGRQPGRDGAMVLAAGGHACKFLVQLRPDRPRRPGAPDLAGEVVETVRAVVEDCRQAGVPSVIETLLYLLPGETALGERQHEDLVVESARLLGELGPDLLKLEYPGSEQGCARVAEAVSCPWAVLSAGAPIEAFEDRIRIACDAGGASGFIAGRAFWKEAVAMSVPERRDFLGGEARRRLEASTALLEGRARPWFAAVA